MKSDQVLRFEGHTRLHDNPNFQLSCGTVVSDTTRKYTSVPISSTQNMVVSLTCTHKMRSKLLISDRIGTQLVAKTTLA